MGVEQGKARVGGVVLEMRARGDDDVRTAFRAIDDAWWDEITWDAREAREGASGR